MSTRAQAVLWIVIAAFAATATDGAASGGCNAGAPCSAVRYGVNQPPWGYLPPDGFEQARAAGFGSVRLFLGWDQIEKQQGVYDWGAQGQLIHGAHAQGFSVIAVLKDTPDWAAGSSCKGSPSCISCPQNVKSAWPPRDPSYFRNFA